MFASDPGATATRSASSGIFRPAVGTDDQRDLGVVVVSAAAVVAACKAVTRAGDNEDHLLWQQISIGLATSLGTWGQHYEGQPDLYCRFLPPQGYSVQTKLEEGEKLVCRGGPAT